MYRRILRHLPLRRHIYEENLSAQKKKQIESTRFQTENEDYRRKKSA